MKLSIVLLATLAIVSSAFASQKKCIDTAEQAVTKKYAKFFVANGKTVREFSFHACSEMKSSQGNKYVKCDLSATAIKDDAGSMDFTALMNADCSRSFAQFILAEE
jgi:hypothetical protein